jgi:hypothetical protein
MQAKCPINQSEPGLLLRIVSFRPIPNEKALQTLIGRLSLVAGGGEPLAWLKLSIIYNIVRSVISSIIQFVVINPLK